MASVHMPGEDRGASCVRMRLSAYWVGQLWQWLSGPHTRRARLTSDHTVKSGLG